MPTKNEVQEHVLNAINAQTNISPEKLKSKYWETALTDAPLSYDDPALAMLTSKLRSYIKKSGSGKTLLVTEVRKSGLTIKDLVDIVYSRVQLTA